MVFEKVFEKELTETDIKHRFSFPTDHLEKLPFQGENCADFQVSCKDGSVWEFRCIKRDAEKDYPKPTITRGWSKVVKDKDLKPGDKLIFYMDSEEEEYKIEVERRHGIWLFGAFIPTGEWYRIV